MKLSNREKRKLVQDDYDAIAEFYANEDKNFKLYSPYISEFVKGLDGKYVLDVGCADGTFSNYLALQGLNVVGIDFSKNLVDIANKRFNNVKFIYDDICNYHFTFRFDGIFSKDTLIHLPDEDLEYVIEKFYHILNKKGKILIILDIPKVAGEEIYDEPLDPKYKLYYNYLTVEKIKKILIRHKFKIDKIGYIDNDQNLYVYAQGIMVIYASK